MEKRLFELREILSDENLTYVKGYPQDNPEDKEYLIQNGQKILDFLDLCYESAGHGKFASFPSLKNMKKNCTMFNVVYFENMIIAATVYSSYLGGYKCVGMGGYPKKINQLIHTLALRALYHIVAEEVEKFDDWVWAEASDGPKIIYENSNATPIPGIIAKDVFSKGPIEICEDGYYYIRGTQMKDMNGQTLNQGHLKKMMFGFNSKETYEKFLKYKEKHIQKGRDKILLEESAFIPNAKLVFYKCNVLSYYLGEADCWQNDSVYPFLKEYIKIAAQEVRRVINKKTLTKSDEFYINGLLQEADFVVNEMPLTPEPKSFVESLREAGVI